jgi:hypothetical protein
MLKRLLSMVKLTAATVPAECIDNDVHVVMFEGWIGVKATQILST